MRKNLIKCQPTAQAIAFFHPDDRRPMFAIPWEGSSLVGATDVDYRHDLDQEPFLGRFDACQGRARAWAEASHAFQARGAA